MSSSEAGLKLRTRLPLKRLVARRRGRPGPVFGIGGLVWGLGMVSVLCVAPCAHASKPDSVPDWVRAAAAQTLPSYPAETKAVVLLEDTTYTVAPDGHAVEHVRHVVKILRPQGRGEATIHVGFDKDTRSSR
jgi:hypothetical protein